MKKLFIVLSLVFAVSGLFAEVEWFSGEDSEFEGVLSRAICTTKKEALEIADLKSFDGLYKKYVNFETFMGVKELPPRDLYIVTFTETQIIIHEIKKNNKMVTAYVK